MSLSGGSVTKCSYQCCAYTSAPKLSKYSYRVKIELTALGLIGNIW